MVASDSPKPTNSTTGHWARGPASRFGKKLRTQSAEGKLVNLRIHPSFTSPRPIRDITWDFAALIFCYGNRCRTVECQRSRWTLGHEKSGVRTRPRWHAGSPSSLSICAVLLAPRRSGGRNYERPADSSRFRQARSVTDPRRLYTRLEALPQFSPFASAILITAKCRSRVWRKNSQKTWSLE